MKKFLLPAFVLSLLTVSVLFVAGFNRPDDTQQVRHIVVFKYKEGATPEQIQKVTDAFRALKDKIPGIVSFETGVNNSPENKNLGFTHVYLLTFENAAARDAYLPHPEHKNFGKLLGEVGILQDAFVVDYHPGK